MCLLSPLGGRGQNVMKKYISKKLDKVIKQSYGLDFKSEVNYPRDNGYGDYSSNAAMALSKQVKKNPQEIAKKIIDEMKQDKKVSDIFSEITQINGFINFKLSEKFLHKELNKILKQKSNYGESDIGGHQKIQLEFVSANPTGPLTMANGRGGFFGDALANVLKKAGYDAYKEYYVNDVGNQIDILAESIARRILEIKGQNEEFPDYCYKGEYIKDIARQFIGDVKAEYNSIGEIAEAVKKYSLMKMVESIKKDLEYAGIVYDRWFFESELYNKAWYQPKSEIDKVFHFLDKENLLEEKDGAVWFQSSQFGDDKDRVVIKDTGEKTYFASDIAYYKNRVDRGFKKIIMPLGADHHGYIPRINAAVKALKCNVKIDFVIFQMVSILEKGELKRMSKRAGKFVLLREILDEVGKDATRFFFLMYDPNTHMDFNLDLAKEKSQKNPVYYVQYAYARISSILKKAEEKEINTAQILSMNQSTGFFCAPAEINLIKQIAKLPNIVEEISQSYEVSKLPRYSLELARSFHDFYENCRVISDDNNLTLHRLRVILGVKIVLAETLRLMGVSAPESM